MILRGAGECWKFDAKQCVGLAARGQEFGGARVGWQQRMQQKFANMTPEEKEMFKTKMQGRCGNRFSGFEDGTVVTQE